VANHKSAAKRARQNEKRKLRNRARRSRVRTLVKRFRTAAETGDVEAARAGFAAAERELRKAASKGVLKKPTASRRISRLAQLLHRIETGSRQAS